MDEICRSQIVSNDYVDFITEYQHSVEEIRERYQTDCINIINHKYAIAHTPDWRLNTDAILEFGYSALPNCYGLEDLRILEASGINRIRQIPNYNYKGKEVLIAIIDTGIDYKNPLFRNSDGSSRIRALWDQTISSENYPRNTNYGTEYTQEQINEALQSEDPYSIVPSTDEIGHGTFLAGIAGGNLDIQNNFSGVATEAEFVIVKLKQAKQKLKDFYVIPDGEPCFQENDIMFAAKYAWDVAREFNRTIAICIALGTNQGGNDGRGFLGGYLSYLGDIVGTAVVVSAGNEGNSGHHFYGEIDKNMGYVPMEININKGEEGFSMEIWGSAPNTYSIDLLSPAGELIPRIPARVGENRVINFTLEETIVEVDYILVEPRSGDQLILVKFKGPSSGLWRFRVYGAGDINLNFHAWLPISKFLTAKAEFLHPNPDTTITGPGTAPVVITTTAYNHLRDTIYSESGRGFTRTNAVKPDIAAPGVDIIGPSINNTFVMVSGTSISAAHAAGVAALMLEWGINNMNYPVLDSVEIKKFFIRGAIRNPNQVYPNKVWGYGRLNIYNTFASLRDNS